MTHNFVPVPVIVTFQGNTINSKSFTNEHEKIEHG